MQNPFRYGAIATGNYFADRVVELTELEADIRNGHNVVIISPRRYGKTSLVFRALEHLKQERILFAYLDLFRTPTKDRFADRLADSIYSGLVAPFERARHRALEIFRSLPTQPTVTINPDGTPSFQFGAAQHARDVDRTIESLLTLPGMIAAQRGRRIAVILDEFQEVVAIDPHLPALMRAVFQLQGGVAHVFMGSRRHLMQRVFTDENQPLYRLARPLSLRPIDVDDFATFIRGRFASTRKQVTDDTIDRVLAITEGHPNDTQELCYFTWAIAQAEGSPPTTGMVDRALNQVVEAEAARYTTLWEQLSVHQRLVLSALVVGGEGVFSEAYRRQHRLGSASSVQRSLDRLLERDLVELLPERRYRVPDVFLRAWITRLTSSNGP